MRIINLWRSFRKSRANYVPQVRVLVSQSHLLHNLAEYRRRYPQLALAPVLKSNAYGHGLVLTGQLLDRANVPFLVVDSLFEAVALRHNGVKSPILVIGYVNVDNVQKCKLNKVVFTLTSLEQLRGIAARLNHPQEFHLKIDTGMHRQGLSPGQLTEAIQIIRQQEFIQLVGVCSHLADADGADDQLTRQQIAVWNQAVDQLKQNFTSLRWIHLSATSGLDYLDVAQGNAARLGIGLYGINVSPRLAMNLKPALQLQTEVSSIRTLEAGDRVGYNGTFRAEKEMRVATVPVGYFEGVDRRLSNTGCFMVKDKCCPIVGRVSMNITSIDVSAVPEINLGEAVTIISNVPGDQNSVENIAKAAGTIPYEILVHIPQHLRRIVV
ncbi:alanine racemase [Patescibacteria group bacterium]|nr:MAG: alanine racemase [Patescibacteria group bacterium]